MDDAPAPMNAVRRARVFAQRFWQPTFACMTCMPGSLMAIGSLAHWAIALQTGLLTGALALLLTFTPAVRLFALRWGSAAMVALLTMAGDAFVHARHDDLRVAEVLQTGLVAGVLALAAAYALPACIRSLRGVWSRIRGPVGE